MHRVALFTGSASGHDPRYASAATELGRHLATSGIGVVYGGAHVGLMGLVADAVLAEGGEVVGVIPRALHERELAHQGLTELVTVETMHERKAEMASRADAFVALPGGAGTLEEIFEVWTWQQLGYHDKPVAFYDTAGYWRPLLEALAGMTDAGFVRRPALDTLVVADRPEQLLALLRDHP
ncbi:MAG: TIGR00730 family Rossman fold protein [Actinomycetota bacterium]|nr:TIGR00730 family Rossman fold protein [Actinomycetota bacterium]